jgi:site-specific recombinase XerD
MNMPDHMKGIPICKRGKSKPVVLDISEVENIISVSVNLKYRIIFSLIYSAGLRVSEAINLTIKDIDLQRNVMHIKSAKGNKDRYVILSKKVLKLYLEYVSKYKPIRWIFYSGCGDKLVPFSARSIQRTFQDHLYKTRIKKNASVHTLRHSFATHLMEQGTNIYHIQALLGHMSPKTTSVYLHVQKSETLQVESPLDYYNISVEKEDPYGDYCI